MTTLIARQSEQRKLERLCQSKKAEFLAIYGRRRIGKTFLINQYFYSKGLLFEVTGIKKASMANQLKKFHREFCRIFASSKLESSNQFLKPPKNWDEALFRLEEECRQINPSRKVILFFDELPWLATPRSHLIQELDYYWNRYFSRMNNIILVICGSSASWMIHKIIQNKEGLYGRLSDKICLQPFKLAEVELYLHAQQVNLDRKQIATIYLVMGGVAKYLSFIEPGKSAVQVVNQLCFTVQGALYSEFNELYSSLFNNAEQHIKIVRLLAKKRQGLTRNQLIQQLKIQSSGQITKILDELECSGIITIVQRFNTKIKDALIRLTDEYSYFYLNWIEPVKREILYGNDGSYWQKLQNDSRWRAWSGFAFETVCLKHIDNIIAALGLSGIKTTYSQWSYQPANNTEDGTQIDLLIDRADNCINICEIKFYNDEYIVTKEYSRKLEKKREIFRQQTKTKKTIFITLITPFGVKKNEYFPGMVDSEILLDDLF